MSLHIDVGIAQLLGGRKNQEDRYGVREVHDSRLLRLVAVVADGMGGHAAGEVAAQIGVDAVLDGEPGARPRTLLERFRQAQDAVTAAGRVHTQRGLGATLTALTARADDTVSWCHLGDSRLTLYRGGESQWLTMDHSVPGALFKRGDLSELEFDRGDGAPGLIQFLGMPIDRGTALPVEQGSLRMAVDDVLLLATDGVHGALRRWVLQTIIDQDREAGAQALAETLVARAVASGGKDADNATCVVLLFRKESS